MIGRGCLRRESSNQIIGFISRQLKLRNVKRRYDIFNNVHLRPQIFWHFHTRRFISNIFSVAKSWFRVVKSDSDVFWVEVFHRREQNAAKTVHCIYELAFGSRERSNRVVGAINEGVTVNEDEVLWSLHYVNVLLGKIVAQAEILLIRNF